MKPSLPTSTRPRLVPGARILFGLLALTAVLMATPSFAAPSFTGVGDLAGGAAISDAYGISGDGLVATGSSEVAAGPEAFLWTTAGGIVGLGDLVGGGVFSSASHVSEDGSTIVGYSGSSLGDEAFRWTSGSGMVGLGDLVGGSFFSFAHASSSDGATVVGDSSGASGIEAFRWTSVTGMVGLGDLPGGSAYSSARSASADGSVIVGFSVGASGTEAFQWTSAGGMTGLGDLPGGSFESYALAITPDASTVVGRGTSASGSEAYRWTSVGGMVGLGDLPGGSFFSSAESVTNDGTTIVGFSSVASGSAAFIWDATNGMRDLSVVLSGLGIDLTGWTLTHATAISGDGRVIVGRGTNPGGFSEGWVAAFDDPALPIPPDPDRFLTYFSAVVPEHVESTETAQAYLAAIDPENARLELNLWLTVNGFDGGADAEATYVNDADLGFGRHMFVKTHLDGRVASYVKNHGDNTLFGFGDVVDGSAEEKIVNVHNNANLIATVAMEYGPPASNPMGDFYTRFFAFDQSGNRIVSANLDGRGEKFLPGVCNVCHGGNARPLLADGSYPDEGETGAGFLPWDLDTLAFSDSLFGGVGGVGGMPIYNRPSQEDAFKIMNQAVLLTNPTPTAKDVIEGWYGGAGTPNATFDGMVVPGGWAGHETAYREVYAPNCRACHMMRNPAVAFETYAEFAAVQPRAQHLVFDRGIMPLARRTYDRLWSGLSVSDPAVIDLFGIVASDRLPGSEVPIAYAGPDQSAAVGVVQTLDASNSSYATSFLWNIDGKPVGSLSTLSDPAIANPTFTPDQPGNYVFKVTASNSNTPGDQFDFVTITATADGGLAGVDFVSELLPIYAASCRVCHKGGVFVGGVLAPDFDGPGTVIDSPEYNEAAYRSFATRANVIDPPNSLLLQKSTGTISHVGGSALLIGSPNYVNVLDWITQGAARVTTPSYQKGDGSFVNPILQYTPIPFSIGGSHPYAGPNLEPGANLTGAALDFAFLNFADLTGANLTNANLGPAELYGSILVGADLTNADLSGATLSLTDLSNAIGVTPAQIESAVVFQEITLVNLNLTGINLSGRSLGAANLTGANLSNANLSATDLQFANLSGANVTGANLTGASISGVDFTNAVGLTTGQIESATEIAEIQLIGFDLAGIDLSGRVLNFADFMDADLNGSNFSGANLGSVNFGGTDLRGADLSSAIGLGTTTGSATYDLATDFTGTSFDPVAAGWTLVAATPVPLLNSLGLLWLSSLLGVLGWRWSRS